MQAHLQAEDADVKAELEVKPEPDQEQKQQDVDKQQKPSEPKQHEHKLKEPPCTQMNPLRPQACLQAEDAKVKAEPEVKPEPDQEPAPEQKPQEGDKEQKPSEPKQHHEHKPKDPLHVDVSRLAESAARKLAALDPAPKIKDQALEFDNPTGVSVRSLRHSAASRCPGLLITAARLLAAPGRLLASLRRSGSGLPSKHSVWAAA